MNLAFLLHFYQPPTQTEGAFKAVVQECYTPLLKLIRSKSNCKFTLNTTLSLLEQLEKYKYTDALATIKELLDNERVELVGSAAYHPLLTKISDENKIKQIILNEYGLGYYFGKRQGFEGETSIMSKDVKGFFAPELAINTGVVEVLSELNYEWAVIDEAAVDTSKPGLVFELNNLSTKLVLRDTELSDLMAFSRDSDVSGAINYVKEAINNNVASLVVVLDAETFGHRNKEGINFLATFLDELAELSVNVISVSKCLEEVTPTKISEINEATRAGLKDGVYPYWDDSDNKIQAKLWEILGLVTKTFADASVPKVEEGFENIAIWNQAQVEKIADPKVVSFLELEMLVNKSIHSDQFLWASNKTMYDQVLFSPTMVNNALGIYKKIAEFDQMSSAKEEIHLLSAEITTLLEAH